MTKRIEVARAPAPLEAYLKHFDPWFGRSNQREGVRQYLEGLVLPSERHTSLTGLVNPEPVVGAQLPRAQKLQWTRSSFAQFAFDLIAVMNGIYRPGFASSLHGLSFVLPPEAE